ncbi:MAG: DEAD/DEAH box helicase [Candidatus Omnitrophota bacterium]|nr:DEAD/DEAH box helicase [Candidatus Omnitrophota bacterium]
MRLPAILTRYGFSAEVQDIFRQSGIAELFPPQAQAVEQGVLDGKNLLLSVPTAAGKTLMAELCMLKSILQEGGRCLYIAPLIALVNEKHDDFKKKYEPLGIKVGMATGDMDAADRYLGRYQILVATSEKVDSLLRSKAKSLINTLSVVIVDEVHLINDGSRGPTLEIILARIRQLNPAAQIMALSATVSNAKEIADWLKAGLVASDWRPIPLKEGVYYNRQIKFNNHPSRVITEDEGDPVSDLTLDTLKSKGQVLVFVNSRRSAQAASRQLCESVSQALTPEEKRQLQALSKDVVGPESSATKICRKLGDVVRHGVAFHHAGLKPEQRKLIEANFKKNLIKAICSTPTLAAGVNLPARRAVIRDCKRFESGLGSAFIPVSEYKQCAGRAGRPQYDPYGEAVLVAKSPAESKVLMEKYVKASPEPVISKLGDESALRIHILSSVAGGYVHDINDTFDFLSHTFLAHQKLLPNPIEIIGRIFDFLLREGFVEKNGFRFFATPFGQCASRLYVEPWTAITLRDGLKKIAAGKSFSHIGLLHLACCCPDAPLLSVGKQDFENLEAFAAKCQDELVFAQGEIPATDDLFRFLSVMKTTWLLNSWIEEEKEDDLCETFGIGPGDIYRHQEAVQWLLHAATVFAELLEARKLTFPLESLRLRVKYGIKEELVELAQLRGVGRVRARNLFAKGLRKLPDLKRLSVDELAAVPQIGKAVAKEIIEQLKTLHPPR